MFELLSYDATICGRFASGQVMQLRELGPDDANVFQALRLAALQECPSALASSYEEECETPIDVVAERLIAKADRCVLGAWIGTEFVGMLGLKRENFRKLAHKAYIWGMYVAPTARRQGVGRALVVAALSRAAAMGGVRQVNLGVNATNAQAIALYEAAGFKAFGIERGFMLLDGVLHDEVMMVRNIDPWTG
ncbi:MAG TPA: GNAT family N-acetyltransferase [Burkholderiaceae bacterium]|jgi:ribosomal protein S18 acetylase RimI-like enzyme|nr:GNAT family N-acetyltransferase [Burkholderiaceae bacterium]